MHLLVEAPAFAGEEVGGGDCEKVWPRLADSSSCCEAGGGDNGGSERQPGELDCGVVCEVQSEL